LAKAVLSERFYSSVRNLQYTRTASFLRAAPRFPAQLLYQHANAPYFPLDFRISYDSEASLKIDGPRHFSSLSADAKAMEAIVNMLRLSRCDVCIRTASQLSVWSRILNSDLKTVSLDRPFVSTAYPEREIWNEENASPSTC
jgi:hypothetical protein